VEVIMIEPIQKSKVVPATEPLPSAWLRMRTTEPDNEAGSGAILRTGPTGRLRSALVRTIDEAQEVVLLASFLLSDEQIADALLRAASRKVRAYVLTASEHRIATFLRDDGDDVSLADQHKKLLDRLANDVVLRSAEHFHAKFVVADPQGRARGWLSTSNFTPALLKSVELGVELDAAAARTLAGWFAWAFWNEAEHELAGKGRLAKTTEPPTAAQAPSPGSVVATTMQHTLLRDRVLALIDAARSDIRVASYGLSAGHPVVQALAAKARSGIPVTVFTRPRPAVKDAATLLVKSGARVLAHDKLHAKGICTDAGAMIMTANLEERGLDTSFETGLLLSPAYASRLGGIFAEWEKDFPWEYSAAPDHAGHLGEICLADSGLRDGIRRVVKEIPVKLAPITARDALRMEETPEPDLQIPAGRDLARQARFEWEVRPPKLPKNAQERLREVTVENKDNKGRTKKSVKLEPYDPPLYEYNGEAYVVLRRPEDEEEIARVAADRNAHVVLP